MHQISKPTLEYFFSKSRIEKYQQYSGDKNFIELYQLNIIWSEKFFTLLSQFEVILRNAISQKLIVDFGENWFNCQSLIFAAKQQQAIDEVTKRLLEKSKNLNPCNVTSNLSFGFWISLFSPNYDKTLWRTSLYNIFSNSSTKLSRSKLRERLQKFLTLRNRISHCECIIHFPLVKYSQQLVETTSWINPEIANWFNKFVEFLAIQNQLNQS